MSIFKEDLGDRMELGLPYATAGTSNQHSYVPTVAYTASPSDVGLPTPEEYEEPKPSIPVDPDKAIEKIKYKVTPDEIFTGMDYELRRMHYKRKSVARKIVIQNLKRDPQFYSKLHMMDIDENGIRKEAIYNIISEMKKKPHLRDL